MVSSNFKKWTTFSISAIFVVLGIIVAICWDGIFHNILKHQLSVESSNTKGFKMWVETPIPMYMEFYLFNWTNAEEVAKNPLIKPTFVECGPYTFLEKHYRINVIFNDNNNTVTYKTKKVWHFLPNRTKGSLEDNIITVNAIALTAIGMVKNSPFYIKIPINLFLKEKAIKMYIKKTAKEFLFDGYDDYLLDLARMLNISINVPSKKFGWFVGRNGSADYDGVFNMYSGRGNLGDLGTIIQWNYNHKVSYYKDTCAEVNGTSGELWYPPKNATEVSLFSPDVCSNIKFHYNGTDMLNGVEGHKFIGISDNFDNGTKYPEMGCFKTDGVQLSSGVRNVSLCKFGAPAFVSYPHFYLADPSYLNAVSGLKPDPSSHTPYITLEPYTGLPLKVNAVFQISFLVEPIKGISIYKMNKTMIPCMWFRQSAVLSTTLTDLAKMMLVLPAAVTFAGVGLVVVGVILLVVFLFVTYKKGWRHSDEASPLLNQDAL